MRDAMLITQGWFTFLFVFAFIGICVVAYHIGTAIARSWIGGKNEEDE